MPHHPLAQVLARYGAPGDDAILSARAFAASFPHFQGLPSRRQSWRLSGASIPCRRGNDERAHGNTPPWLGQKGSPAGAGPVVTLGVDPPPRCGVLPRTFLAVSTARLFWGYSRVESRPGDPCSAARASRPRRCVGAARPALPPGCPIRIQPAATTILHGLAHRTAPQTEGIATRHRASRWPAGRLTDLCGSMSAFVLISSGLPPTADILDKPGNVSS